MQNSLFFCIWNSKYFVKLGLWWEIIFWISLKIYGAPKLCTETTLSKYPVVLPKSSCDVHLLRSFWLGGQDCVAANNNGNGEWDDDKCDDLKSFVCEKGTGIIYFKADSLGNLKMIFSCLQFLQKTKKNSALACKKGLKKHFIMLSSPKLLISMYNELDLFGWFDHILEAREENFFCFCFWRIWRHENNLLRIPDLFRLRGLTMYMTITLHKKSELF